MHEVPHGRVDAQILANVLLPARNMLRVFKASGEEVLAIPLAEFLEVTGRREQHVLALDLKRHLQGLCGQPRFRQRLLLPDGQILSDDAKLNEPVDVQLIFLSLSPTSTMQIGELWDAAHNGDVPRVENLLRRPQDPNLEFICGTPLYCAAANGHVEAVRLLLEACAHKDWADVHGTTPIFLASCEGHVEVVRVLLEARADNTHANRDGQTPIIAACRTGHLEVVRLLLEARADKDLVDSLGATPLSAASERGYTQVAQLLVEKQLLPDACEFWY